MMWLWAVVAAVSVVTVRGASDTNYTVTAEAWFDIEIKDYDGPGEDYRGRVVIGLFGKTVPMTVMNFASITKGYERKKDHSRTEKLHYKNALFHRVVPDFVIQGGDVTTGDGTGGKSIFGEKFVDENYILSHKAAGYVSMANHGRDTNGSQFFILLNKSRWLDTKHVVFGKVIRGMETIRAIGEVPTTDDARPKKKVKIIDCGIDDLDDNKQYVLTDAEATSDEDLDRP